MNCQGALVVRKKLSLEYGALDGLLSRTNVTHFTQEKFSRKWTVLEVYIILELIKFYWTSQGKKISIPPRADLIGLFLLRAKQLKERKACHAGNSIKAAHCAFNQIGLEWSSSYVLVQRTWITRLLEIQLHQRYNQHSASQQFELSRSSVPWMSIFIPLSRLLAHPSISNLRIHGRTRTVSVCTESLGVGLSKWTRAPLVTGKGFSEAVASQELNVLMSFGHYTYSRTAPQTDHRPDCSGNSWLGASSILFTRTTK